MKDAPNSNTASFLSSATLNDITASVLIHCGLPLIPVTMGLTKACNAPGLTFEFDKPRHHYSPGDRISGRVILNTATESAIGKVAVYFWGRAKSRIIQQHGQSATTHRGRTQFFYQQQTLYEGQYTHKPGFFSWPFEFVVPYEADPVCIRASDKWKPKENYMSTQDQDLDLTLPATMFHRRYTFGRQADCFIEYVLEATVTEPEGLHAIRKPQTKLTSYPIIFHPLSTPEPIQNYECTTHNRHITISTLKLLPEHSGTSLGIRDMARSIFQRDTIPRFSFHLTVEAPTVIQLFHPDPIPFRIMAQPDVKPENTTVDCTTGFPEVILRWAKIELKAFIRSRAPGTYADTKTYDIPILPQRILNERLAMAHGATSAAKATIDLGQLCDLRLGNAKLSSSRSESPLCPSFTSYNVSRSYQLTWELEVECAEKTEKIYSSYNVPDCAVIMQPATIRLDYPDKNTAQGPELARPASAHSAGSGSGSRLGWWSSRRRSGEAGGNAGQYRTEKEKATFGHSGLIAEGGTSEKKNHRILTKEEAAAEDRARARLEEEQEQDRHQLYPDSEPEPEPSFVSNITTRSGLDSNQGDTDINSYSTRTLPIREIGAGAEQSPPPPPSPSPLTILTTTDHAEPDVPPPRYVP